MKQIRLSVLAGAGILFMAAPAMADPIELLLVGNSFTHGRYSPVLNYNAGSATSTGTNVVHDLLSNTAAEKPSSPANPSNNPPPGSTLAAQLTYLQNNPASQYTEVGPFGGVAGMFLQFTKEAGLNYDVSLVAVSSATLTGYLNNTGSEAGDLALIASSTWNKVVLQDQSFQPLPSTVTVNGQSVPTRGKPTSFQSGVNGLVNAIDAADTAAGKANAAVTLAQTPPLAAYGYTSSNPAQPIFGSSTVAGQNGNPAYAPYVGDADPNAAMASDLHNAYYGEAAAYDAANPSKSRLNVAPDGDAWITAMNLGFAQRNPYLTNEPAGQIDLWDSDPLEACCTVPIGYHPSVYGDYLNALSLFETITGDDPRTSLLAEFDPANTSSVATTFGISPTIAFELATAAGLTVAAQGPASSVPEPGSLALAGAGLLGLAGLRRTRV